MCEVDEQIAAPVLKGDVLGSVTYINRKTGIVLLESALIAAKDVGVIRIAAALPKNTPLSPQEASQAVQIAAKSNDSAMPARLLFGSIWLIIVLLLLALILWIFFRRKGIRSL